MEISDVSTVQKNLQTVGETVVSNKKVIYYTNDKGELGTLSWWNIPGRIYRSLTGESDKNKVFQVMQQTETIGKELNAGKSDLTESEIKSLLKARTYTSGKISEEANTLKDLHVGLLLKKYGPDV